MGLEVQICKKNTMTMQAFINFGIFSLSIFHGNSVNEILYKDSFNDKNGNKA